MSKKININPVPDINTHDFTIFALNELYENQFKMQKQIKRMRSRSRIRFAILSGVIYYIYQLLNEKIEKSAE